MGVWKLIVAALTAFAAAITPGTPGAGPGYYSNQTPYPTATTTLTVAPPAGYSLFFIETVGRHGARSLTDAAPEKRALALWSRASKTGGLTAVGGRFASDLAAFQRAERSVGYGDLSAVGAQEWAGIGRRTAASYAAFFSRLAPSRDEVDFVTSPVRRTMQSAAAMKKSIASAFPEVRYGRQSVDLRLLVTDGATPAGNAAIAVAKKRAAVREAAYAVLRRLYSASFVRTIADPVDAAMDVYLLYCTAPGMAGETSVTFARYVPARAARALGSFKDAQNFYRYGPGVAGQTSSYAQAEPLLADFFARLDQRIAGGKDAAVFRLAHGETVMPFEALIGSPGSEEQAPLAQPYSYATNPWRGDVAGLLAGNVEWTAFRNDTGSVLVTLRQNERPARFRSSCTATTAGGYFYTVRELKHCLG